MVLQCGQLEVHCLSFFPGWFLFNRADITQEHRQEIKLCRAYSTVLSLRDREDTVSGFLKEALMLKVITPHGF